jgi:hypothetical protein
MTQARHSASLADLLGGLVDDITLLFRKEVQLAKAEASEKVEEVVGAGRSLLIGAVLAIGAVGVLLAALVSIVAALLVGMGVAETFAPAIAGFLVAAVIGGIAWALIASGLNAIKATNLQPRRTAHALAEDMQVVQENLK